VLTEAGLSTDIRAPWWYSSHRHRLGERRDILWLAWQTLDACLMARQRLSEGDAQLAIEHACEAWRYAFWREVSARRRTLKQLRDNSRMAHGVPDIEKRIASYQAALERCGRKEEAKRIAAEQCGRSPRTIERALQRRT
jgi:hypothetical protein